jgi:hypothetical protein
MKKLLALLGALLCTLPAWALDVAMPETGVTTYHSANIKGQGVLVGIVDTGIDPYHADFWATASVTRIKGIWEQTLTGGGPPPAGYTYGTEYTEAQINAHIARTDIDTQGRGTHLAGIVAGNGRATGNGQPANVYVGMAPEASIVAVELRSNPDGTIPDNRIVDAVKYVFGKATALGMPAVVCLAESRIFSPHDGSSTLEFSLDSLSGPGRIICAPAGTYGHNTIQAGIDSLHAEGSTNGIGQQINNTFVVRPYTPTGGDFFATESWYKSTANYTVSVIMPGDSIVGPVSRGDTLTYAYTSKGVISISNGLSQSTNGSYRVSVNFSQANPSYPPIGTGTWKLRFTAQNASAEKVHSYLPQTTPYLTGQASPAFTVGMTNRYLTGAPGTRVLDAGGYITRRRWTACNGSQYFFWSLDPGPLIPASSPGPRVDGTISPLVCAPASAIISSRSATYFPSDFMLARDCVHVAMAGTQQAAAFLAGATALLLQTNPVLTPAAARETFLLRADSDVFTGTVPSDSWGYGKLTLRKCP